MRKAAQLIGDEVSGETKATVVLTTTRRTRWCLGFDLYWPQPIAATCTAARRSSGGSAQRRDGDGDRISTITGYAEFPHPNVNLVHPPEGPAMVGDGPATVTGCGGNIPTRLRAAGKLTERG